MPPRSQPPAAARSVLVAHPSADLYGSDRVLLESVDAMVAAGWSVLVTLPAPGPLVAALAARGVEVAICPSPVLRKSALSLRGLLGLVVAVLTSVLPGCRLILRSRARHVHVNTLTIPLWLVLGRLLGRQVTCHVHEAESSGRPLVRRLIVLPLLLAQRIVVNSHFSLDVLAAAVPRLRARSEVVDNAVPGPAEVTPARVRLDGPVRLLFVGRLSPRKGPQVAVGAAALLARAGVPVRLELLGAVFPGYEWFADELRAAVTAAGLQDAVTFLGFRDDVWPHLQQADVVLVPSVLDEPFGNTAVEAVLAARPLVASDTSGLREAAAGYRSAQLVAPDRPELVAEAVLTLAAEWADYRALALTDAGAARERHAPARYRRELVRVLTS